MVCDTLDLSGQGLKKLARCPSDAEISTLILDDNELQRLDNLDSYHRINKVFLIVLTNRHNNTKYIIQRHYNNTKFNYVNILLAMSFVI